MIRARIPGVASFINRSIDELEAELAHLGRPVVVDAGVRSILCYLVSTINIIPVKIFFTLALILSGSAIHYSRVMSCF